MRDIVRLWFLWTVVSVIAAAFDTPQSALFAFAACVVAFFGVNALNNLVGRFTSRR